MNGFGRGTGSYDRIDRLTEAQFDPLPRVVSPELCPSHFSEINGLGRHTILAPEAADREQRRGGVNPTGSDPAVPLRSRWIDRPHPLSAVFACTVAAALLSVFALVSGNPLWWFSAAWSAALALACLVLARAHPTDI